MYILKPPLQVNCSQCQKKLTVDFCPPRQQHSNKNHWGYWTSQKQNLGQYRCDSCLIDMYRNHKLVYLDSITDSKKRRTFRAYFGGNKVGLLTRIKQKQLKVEKGEVSDALRRKGTSLAKEGLNNYIENWRQAMLKLIEENSLLNKKNRELEKKLAKKHKGLPKKSKN